MTPTFSLIVTTINKKDELKRFFTSINNQLGIFLSEIQIIFVDQGSNFESTKFLNKEITLDYVSIPIGSLSKARNVGLEKAKGEIIAFPDDDCWYHEDLLSKLKSSFAEKHDVLCLNVKDPIKNLNYGNRPDNIITDISYKNILKLPISVGIFSKSSFIIKNDLRFDENLGAGNRWGAGEESDFLLRLIPFVKNIKYNGFLSVYHPVEEYVEIDKAKYFKYGLGMGALLAKHFNKKEGLLGYYIWVLFRGILGFCYHGILFNRNKAIVYLNRNKGIFYGFFEAKKYYANNS